MANDPSTMKAWMGKNGVTPKGAAPKAPATGTVEEDEMVRDRMAQMAEGGSTALYPAMEALEEAAETIESALADVPDLGDMLLQPKRLDPAALAALMSLLDVVGQEFPAVREGLEEVLEESGPIAWKDVKGLAQHFETEGYAEDGMLMAGWVFHTLTALAEGGPAPGAEEGAEDEMMDSGMDDEEMP